MKYIRLILFVCLMFSQTVFASPVQEIETYYQHPDLYQAKILIQNLSDEKVLENSPGSYPLMAGFLGGLVLKRPTFIHQLKQMPLSPVMKALVDHVDVQTRQARYDIGVYLDVRQIHEPKNIDTLWGLFYATGNGKILETIRNYIIWQCQTRPDTEINVTSLMAMSSLQANAANHPLVRMAWYQVLQTPSVQRKLALLQNFDKLIQ